jgi:hypothetical protein
VPKELYHLDSSEWPLQTLRRFCGEGTMLNRRTFLATAGATLITGPTASLVQTTSSKKLCVVVVANRYHEADGFMAALGNQMARSPNLSLPHDVIWPRAFPPDLKLSPKPRCLIDVKKNPSDTDPSAAMEIWSSTILPIQRETAAPRRPR